MVSGFFPSSVSFMFKLSLTNVLMLLPAGHVVIFKTWPLNDGQIAGLAGPTKEGNPLLY